MYGGVFVNLGELLFCGNVLLTARVLCPAELVVLEEISLSILFIV